jgi:hypothetical protein
VPVPSRRKLFLAAGTLILVAATLTAFLLTRTTAASELDTFWAPLFRNREVIQVSVGQPGKLYRFTGPRNAELDRAIQGGNGPDTTIAASELEWIAPEYLYMRDAFAATRIASWIQSKGARSVGTATTQDYAIVTRVFDPSTEHTVISVAGIESYGTLAAGEFVTDPRYLGETLLHAQRDWRRKNVQIVLGTQIIEGTPGPPKVLATHYW